MKRSELKLFSNLEGLKDEFHLTVNNLSKDSKTSRKSFEVTDKIQKKDFLKLKEYEKDFLKLKEYEKELIELNKNLEKRIEEEVEKNRKQQLVLMQQSRLAQMGEMISMIAHQWRQPLNILSLVTQGVVLKYRTGKLNDAVVEKFAESSKKIIFQMSTTIDDFKDFFKPEKEKVLFDIVKPIRHVLEIVEPILKKERIKLDVNMQDGFFIEGYPNELGQALINILNNAKDALLENNIDSVKIIKVYTISSADKISIVVEDNAGGIKEELLSEIFYPYFSTKLDKNGTGLGLYMTKMIIEEHMQGKIDLQNSNEGIKFIIEFKL